MLLSGYRGKVSICYSRRSAFKSMMFVNLQGSGAGHMLKESTFTRVGGDEMYKTILVPLDGSVRAETILAHVEEIAHAGGAKVVLLRVVDPVASLTGLEGIPYDMSRDFIKQETDEAQLYLENKAKELRKKDVQTSTRIRYGEVVKTISEVAEAEKADLIALASHGRTGLSRLFYGSVAAGVLNRADRPLLLIRADKENGS